MPTTDVNSGVGAVVKLNRVRLCSGQVRVRENFIDSDTDWLGIGLSRGPADIGTATPAVNRSVGIVYCQ